MAVDSSDDALWTLRPPNTDAATYLTYVEENITKEKLAILHDVLQDEELADSIGWDLVSTLVPLLPESTECLLAVAKSGNPKEVVLKVTESLRSIEFEEAEQTETKVEVEASGKNAQPVEDEQSLPILQFQVLLQMLSILHPRIKAKAPSRFLSSSLQAVLAACSNASHSQDILMQSMVKFIKTMTGTKRPHFPPRRSSSAVLLTTLANQNPPTNLGVNTEAPPSEEDKIQKKLLQSFVTHMLDEYMHALEPYDDIAGLAWGTRYWEKIQHPYHIPSKVSIMDKFNNAAQLEIRLTTVGQVVAIAQDLEIHSEDLLVTILDPSPELEGDRGEEDSYPSTADSIPLSKNGSLYLFTARKAMEVLYGGPSITEDIPIFPGHAILTRVFVDPLGEEGLRATPEPLLDALLFHALVALHQHNVGEAQSEEQFAEYLQATSLISASVTSPIVRFHAHYITSAVLHSHPKEVARFTYINDTLEHCPFESLKGSAVGWFKEETLNANQDLKSDTQVEESNSVFATEIPLSTLAPLLWPDVTSQYDFKTANTSEAIQDPAASYSELVINYAFYAASLNFLLLMLKAKYLHERLKVKKAVEDSEAFKNFVRPLREAVAHFETIAKLEGDVSGFEEAESGRVMELNMLQMVTTEVEEELKSLGWEIAEMTI